LNFAAIVSYISFVELEKFYKMALIKFPGNRNPIAHALCAGSFAYLNTWILSWPKLLLAHFFREVCLFGFGVTVIWSWLMLT